MNSSLVANRAIRNLFYSIFRLLVGVASTICTSAVIARTLGPTDMGSYGYIMWLVGTAGVFANLGLPAALTKYLAEHVGRNESFMAARIAKRLLTVQLGMATLLGGATGCLMWFGTTQRGMIAVAVALIFTQALIQSLVASLAGIQRFDRIAKISIYLAISQMVLATSAALAHAGVVGMLWTTFAGSIAATWLYYYQVSSLVFRSAAQTCNTRTQPPETYPKIIKFGLTISYILVLDTIVWQRSEILFLKWYSTLPEIAIYTLAYSIATKFNDIASAFSSTLMPLFSESYGRRGLDEIRIIYTVVLKYIQIIMVFPCLLAASVCKPLVHLIYGPAYNGLVGPLQLLLISVAVTSIGAVGSPVLVGTGRQGFMAVYGTLIAIVNVTLDFMLIPAHGSMGASIANCTAQILGVLGGTIYTIHCVRGAYPWRSTATVYACACIGALPAAYLSFSAHPGTIVLAGAALVGAILYLGLLAVTRELGKSEIAAVKLALLDKLPGTVTLKSSDLAQVPTG